MHLHANPNSANLLIYTHEHQHDALIHGLIADMAESSLDLQPFCAFKLRFLLLSFEKHQRPVLLDYTSVLPCWERETLKFLLRKLQ